MKNKLSRMMFFVLALLMVMVMSLVPQMAITVSAEDASVDPYAALQGKTISILGDSISTFKNWSDGDACTTANSTLGAANWHYNGERKNVVSADDTWWKQTADALGMEILVNNSWAGSFISTTGTEGAGYVPAAYIDRCVQLHADVGANAGKTPDVIAFYMGTNDFHRYGEEGLTTLPMGTAEATLAKTELTEPETVMDAYAICLQKMTQRYPDAQIYCFTLLPVQTGGTLTDPSAFNTEIKALATANGAKVVDLYNCGIRAEAEHFSKWLGDTLHPNDKGMDAITEAFKAELLRNHGDVHEIAYTLTGVTAIDGLPTAVVPGGTLTVQLAYDSMRAETNNVVVTDAEGQAVAHTYANGVLTVENVTSDLSVTLNGAGYAHGNHEGWIVWTESTKTAITDELMANGGKVVFEAGDANRISKTISLSGGQEVTICLNGQTVTTGVTRAFRLSNGSKLTICDCTASKTEETYTAGTIKYNYTKDASRLKGAIVGLYESAGSFTMYDGILDGDGKDNSAGGVGGLVDMNCNSSIRIYGGELKNMTSTSGGAIYASSGSVLLDGDVKISGCTATNGGAIYVTGNDKLTINDGVTITGCTATAGGGAIYVADATVNITGGTISNNNAANGGAIHQNGTNTVSVTGGTITGNKTVGSSTFGGAFYAEKGALKIDGTAGVTITNNYAVWGGGAIYNKATATVDITNTTFTGNSAGTCGGAICVMDNGSGKAYVTLKGTVVCKDNYITTGTYSNNITLCSGARILDISGLMEGSSIGINAKNADANIIKEHAITTTGVTEAQLAYVFSDHGHDVTLESGQLWVRVKAHSPLDENYHANDGTPAAWGTTSGQLTSLPTSGQYYLTADVHLKTLTSMTETAHNLILCLNGYDIYTASGVRAFRMNGGANLTICDCSAHEDENDGTYYAGRIIPAVAEGGAIGLYPVKSTEETDTVFTLRDGIIDGTGVTNTGKNGGAIMMAYGTANGTSCKAVVNIQGGEFRNCSANNGGAIYTKYDNELNITGGKFTGNYAKTSGGAIYFESGILNISGATFTGNSTGSTGGTIYAKTGTVTIGTSTFTGNHGNYGGVVYITGATPMTLQDGVVMTGNYAAKCGGAIRQETADGGTTAHLTLSGKVIIKDNYLSSANSAKYTNNLNLCNATRVVALNGLAAGSEIGVTTHNDSGGATANVAVAHDFVLSGTATAADASCFFSDEGHDITCESGVLWIRPRTCDTAGTYHTANGDSAPQPWGTSYTALKSLPASGTYYLQADVHLASVSQLASEDNQVTLCLNGYSIYTPGNSRIFRLNGGANVTICDCTAHEDNGVYYAGKLIPGTTQGGAVGLYPDRSVETVNTEFTLRDGIIDGTGVTSTGAGGAIHISHNKAGNKAVGVVHIVNGEIRNCTATLNGGAICVNSDGILNIAGGKMIGNASAAKGGAIYLGEGTVNISGDPVITGNHVGETEQNLYLLQNNDVINLSALTDGASIGVTAQRTIAEGEKSKIAAVADASYKAGMLHSDVKQRTVKTDTDGATELYLMELAVAAEIDGVKYYDPAEAIVAAGATHVVRMNQDYTKDLVLDGNLQLDLNGYDITGDISGEGTLYLIDSKTNDYTVKDEDGYGTITSITGVDVSDWHKVGGKYYLVLDLEDGISAHRVYSSVTAKALRPNSTGIGFQARFATNEVAREKITGFGMNLVVKDGETVKGTVPLDVMALSDRKLDSAGTPLMFAIKDFLPNTDKAIAENAANEAELIAENNTCANYTIVGTPFIKLSESESYNGTDSTVTFKGMVTTADTNFTSYNETQQEAVNKMYTTFSKTMSGWELEKIGK